MNKSIIFFALFLFVMKSKGQPCNCADVVSNISQLVKEKYAGYGFKTNDYKFKELERHIKRKTLTTKSGDCGKLIFEYLKYFRDRHISFDEIIDTSAYIKVRKKNIEAYLKRPQTDSLQGLWTSQNHFYTVFVQKEDNILKGYIIDSKVKRYKRGDLKFELFLSNAGVPVLINYQRKKDYTEKNYSIGKVSKSRITDGNLMFKKTSIDSLEDILEKPLVYDDYQPRIVKADNSVVITIPSFIYSPYYAILDSLVSQYDSLIKTSKNLIIDLRDNGGGATDVSYPLFKYLYTQPYKIFGACNLSTVEIIRTLKESLKDTAIYTASELVSYTKLVDTLEKSIGKIICDTIETRIFPEVLKHPQNVAIIMNEFTMSAAEIFILIARQSKKVKLFGGYSGGVVDFGWPTEVFTGCKNYTLSLPVQTNTDYPLKKYDMKGIKPDVLIPETESDWVRFILNYYEK